MNVSMPSALIVWEESGQVEPKDGERSIDAPFVLVTVFGFSISLGNRYLVAVKVYRSHETRRIEKPDEYIEWLSPRYNSDRIEATRRAIRMFDEKIAELVSEGYAFKKLESR